MDKLIVRFYNSPWGNSEDKQYFINLIPSDWSLRLELVCYQNRLQLAIRGK